MNFKKLSFLNADGIKIGARLDLPSDSPPVAYALFAHCFTCTKNVTALRHISRALTNEGIALLRFDFTGLGESEGDFAETNFSSNVADLVAAADFLATDFKAPEILIGHSLGGAAVLQAASQIPSALAVATIGAPCNPEHVTHLFTCSIETISACGEAEVVLSGRKFKIKKQFIDDLEERRMDETIRKLKKALLIFHSPFDNTVGIENAAHIFQAAKHPKSFVSLDRADHLLSNREDSLYVGSVLASWAKKYINRPQAKPAEKPLSLSAHHVVVRTGRAKYRTEIKTRSGHTMIADEPVKVGGTNLGADPFAYLMSALGSCMCITLRMYADRKGWPLEEVIVGLQFRKIDAYDCDECQTKKGQVGLIESEFQFVGSLDDKQRSRLLKIASMCPVHRTLKSEIIIRKQLKA
jgi:putative redox protein